MPEFIFEGSKEEAHSALGSIKRALLDRDVFKVTCKEYKKTVAKDFKRMDDYFRKLREG